MNQVWHEDHFVCSGPCKKPLSGTEYFERENKPYCKPDFDKLFAAKKGDMLDLCKIDMTTLFNYKICRYLLHCVEDSNSNRNNFILAPAKPLTAK